MGVPDPTAVTPPVCPCGEIHEFSAATRVAYENITRGLPGTVVVAVVGAGTWMVPRIFIAAHGLKAADLPGLADRYGFARRGASDDPE